MRPNEQDISSLLADFTAIGIALSVEHDHARLLEMILGRAQRMVGADGGTIYSRTGDDQLRFEIMLSESLRIHKGGTSAAAIDLPPLPLYDERGRPNRHAVAVCAALDCMTINVADADNDARFDFSTARAFDEATGYRSRSFLTVPMLNHENEVIGVLQLINAMDPMTGEARSFSEFDQLLVEALASQAAVAITNRSLIRAQTELFNALIQLIANAIDEKSPYTAGHCRRVPVLTNLLAEAVNRVDYGPLARFSMTDAEKYELEVAAWLHDCGKITTPEYIVDKATKLETIFDRIHLVDCRFEILKKEAEIAALQRLLNEAGVGEPELLVARDPLYRLRIEDLDEQRAFIRRSNIGTESLAPGDTGRIAAIGRQCWRDGDQHERQLLTEDEIQNLQVSRGTLTAHEREIIHNHAAVSIKMLESLPYPRHLQRVPEYAGGHHEKLDGSGYPRGLTGEQMSIPARILAIADIFEALTAPDRPYKRAMPLSQALRILGQMKQDGRIDADLFDIFVWEKVYLGYARQHLDPAQRDAVDPETIPGYASPPHAGRGQNR